MKEVISIKYEWTTITWAKIMHLGQNSKFARCQNPYHFQNLKIFRGTKTLMDKMFGDFLFEKTRLLRLCEIHNALQLSVLLLPHVFLLALLKI